MSKSKLVSSHEIAHPNARVTDAWRILTEIAGQQGLITYTDFSEKLLGKVAPRSRAMRLGQLYTYCKQRDLPLLTALVVTKKTKKPAEEAPYTQSSIESEIEKVWAYDWSRLNGPVLEDLDDL